MSDHYQVKFQHSGQTRYGIVDRFSDEAKKLPPGVLLVEDAIRPTAYAVKETDLTDIPLAFGRNEKDEYHQYVETELNKAMAASRALTWVQVGSIFSVPVADGGAYYVVTKVNKTTAKYEWRGFHPDRWVDQILGYEGSVKLSQIQNLVRRYQGTPLFGSSAK